MRNGGNIFKVKKAGRATVKLVRGMLLFLLCMTFLLPARYADAQTRKRMNQRITLKRTDKIPYGTYVAYENLKYIFPDAELKINKESPSRYNSFAASQSYYSSDDDADQKKKEQILYIIISPYFVPGEREFNSIMEFVGRGNHVFISALYWGREFQDSMKIDIYSHRFMYSQDSLGMSVENPVNADSLPFTYPGKPDPGYFEDYDTTYADVLGTDDNGNVNFIKHTYQGGGSIYLHANPLAFTNFFLLHKKNNEYYNNVFSYIPQDIKTIQWDEYFRYGSSSSGSRSGGGSHALKVIMDHDGLRFAFWLVLLIFLLIYLFESKRKQRIIPGIAPLRNTSLDFVKTIGRLYYQYRDNKNLASKMTAHLMDHIRHRYNIPTSVMDEKFMTMLAYKSGYDLAALQKLFYHARMMQDSPRVSDEYLIEFNKMTEAFYKHQ